MIPFWGVSISCPASPSSCPSFLQPELARGGGRVLHVSSLGHRHGKVDIDNLNRHPVYTADRTEKSFLQLFHHNCLMWQPTPPAEGTLFRGPGPGFLAVEWFGFFPLHSPYLSSRQQVVSLSQSSSVSPVELTNDRRRGGGRTLKSAGAKSYDGEKASSSIILSGHKVVCFTSSCLLPAFFYFRIVMLCALLPPACMMHLCMLVCMSFILLAYFLAVCPPVSLFF